MLEDDGYGKLGFYSNAAAYLAVAIGCVMSTSLMDKYGEIYLMIIGSFLNIPCMASFILCSLKSESDPEVASSSWYFSELFVYTVILLFSFLRGFGEAILFVASGKYIADCATDSNKGFFFGYFWAIFMGSEVFGNLVAALVLGKLS